MSKYRISQTFPMKDWLQMDDFIARSYGKDHVLRKRELFDWLFLRNGSEEANVIIGYDEEKLVSLLGYIPTEFYFNGAIVKGAWMANWMTLEGYRNGIGTLLMRKITEMFPLAAGQGASQMNEQIVRKMGFHFLHQIPKLVYVFNPSLTRKVFEFEATSQKSFASSMGEPRTSSLSIGEHDPDWRLYPSLSFSSLRDANYLNSRFIKYPFFDYKFFSKGPAHAPSVCVLRVINANDELGNHVARVGRILEFFFPENAEGKASAIELLEEIMAFLRDEACDFVDYYCSSPAYLDFLLEQGLERDVQGALPSLLDPVDRGRKFQNFEVFVSRELLSSYPRACENFFVTRADGDQDRPNKSYRGK